MENREDLGKQLAQFGNRIRDVKDTMGALHTKGINTFQWALHRVCVLLSPKASATKTDYLCFLFLVHEA